MELGESSVRWLWVIVGLGAMAGIVAYPSRGSATEFTVYNVLKNLDLGTPEETTRKDYYVNMGANQGVRLGSTLEVYRRVPTYDGENQKYYQDIIFAFAKLKVIHVEKSAAVGRLEKFLPPEKTPVAIPQMVMVGDIVRLNSE
jgi:hypothetical protein